MGSKAWRLGLSRGRLMAQKGAEDPTAVYGSTSSPRASTMEALPEPPGT